MATLEELQARIQRLEDIKAIEKLQRIYGYYRDYSDWQKVVGLFSDSAESVEVADLGVYRAPPTAFHPYPSGFHLPYSFKHPVTGK